jgi:hypothetical protein
VSGRPAARRRRFSEAEVAELMRPLPSIAELLQRPEPPPLDPVEIPAWVYEVPSWVKGQGLEKLTRPAGQGEFPAPALQLPRRLTVVDDDGEHRFEFVPDFGGALVVYGKGFGPDARGFSEGCLGRFSPFGSQSIAIEGDADGRHLVVVEGPDATTRVIEIDEREVPSLHVEVVTPDPAQPWLLKSDVAAFRLDRVLSLELVDVAEG